MNIPLIIFVIGVIVILAVFFLRKKSNKTNNKAALNNNEIMVPLLEKVQLNHDTFDFIFGLPQNDMVLGIGVGQHVVLHAKISTQGKPEGEEISRKYTPTSKVDEKGKFILLVKIYRKNVHPKFPEGGKMTQYLESMQIGDKIRISGPKGKLQYLQKGKVLIQTDKGSRLKNVEKIGMISGGTGITPNYQIIKKVCESLEDNTELKLLFANKSEEDILLRKELEMFERTGKLNLYFTLDNPPVNWKGWSGFITKEMISETMPAASPNVLICLCGPPMMNKLVISLLLELGHKEENIFKF